LINKIYFQETHLVMFSFSMSVSQVLYAFFLTVSVYFFLIILVVMLGSREEKNPKVHKFFDSDLEELDSILVEFSSIKEKNLTTETVLLAISTEQMAVACFQ